MVEQAENIDVALLPHLVMLNDDELCVPLRVKRQDVSKLRAVKLTEEEVPRVEAFQAYLHDRGFLPDNSFAALFVYIYNLAYTIFERIAAQEADKEASGGERKA